MKFIEINEYNKIKINHINKIYINIITITILMSITILSLLLIKINNYYENELIINNQIITIINTSDINIFKNNTMLINNKEYKYNIISKEKYNNNYILTLDIKSYDKNNNKYKILINKINLLEYIIKIIERN